MPLNAAAPSARGAWPVVDLALLLSFLLSGCSALIYQVAWQRALYAVVGVDVESMTIVVSVFMLGIGLGGAWGGWLADRLPRRRMLVYGAAELAIALYGACSLAALGGLDAMLSTGAWGDGRWPAAVLCFGFLLLPTVLMGMTLPVLTLAFNAQRGNIGFAVGTLYFVNTLGAALGAIAVPWLLLPRLGLEQVVAVAVAGNVCVALLVLLAHVAARLRWTR